MDVYAIKEYLINNPEKIVDILHDCEFYHITKMGNEYRCAFDEDGNRTRIRVNFHTLASSDFKEGLNGDIISLVQHKTGKRFRSALNFICKSVGLKKSDLKEREDVELPFGGFFETLKNDVAETYEIQGIDECLLKDFPLVCNKMFLRDNITPETQEKFHIGYDIETQRITIPHWDTEGNLVGIMGRLNDYNIPEGTSKYLPIYPFAKSKTLYGYHINYSSIKQSDIVFVFESEKSVMQLDSYNLPCAVALGGSQLSHIQARHIQSLMVSHCILCFDEGLDESFIIEQAKRVKYDNPLMDMKVGYIWDSENTYLENGSKLSPSDKGKGIFQDIIENCVVWI